MLQSILIPAASAENPEKIVMEIAVSQLSLKNFGNTYNSVDLVWISGDNSIKAAAYEIYRNDKHIKTTTSFTYTDTELTQNTKYKYKVIAKAADGKVIKESNSLDVTTLEKDTETLTTSDIALNESLTGSAITLEQAEKHELENIDQVKLFIKGNPDFETDRFIIKYKKVKIIV